MGMSMGLAIAFVCLLLIAFSRAICLRDETNTGFFPCEGVMGRLAKNLFPNLMEKEAFKPRAMPFHVAGITDPETRALLPGHLLLMIGMLVSLAVYIVWFYETSAGTPQHWPVGFYLLLLIFWLSRVVGIVTFLVDRYRIPVVLIVLGYILVFSDKHRYFCLLYTSDAADE